MKVKFRGIKTKIEFLKYDDTIDKECYSGLINNGLHFYNKYEYNKLVENLTKNDFNKISWNLTKCSSDKVFDHSCRFYFKIIKNKYFKHNI